MRKKIKILCEGNSSLIYLCFFSISQTALHYYSNCGDGARYK